MIEQDRTTRQIGISPKVLNPLIVGAIAGLALVVAGLITDTDELLSAGVALILGAVGITGGVGYSSNPGTVSKVQPPPVAAAPPPPPPATARKPRSRPRGGAGGSVGP